jgi:hypothetical protein
MADAALTSPNPQSGQALAELALAAPLLLFAFWMLWTLAMLLQAKLELCSLAREAVLGRGRAYQGSADLGKDLSRIKTMAKATTHLDPNQLRLAIAPVGAIDTAAASANTGDKDINDRTSQGFLGVLMGKISSGFTGDMLTLTYHYQLSGPLANLAPNGLLLKEKLAGISDCWTIAFPLL